MGLWWMCDASGEAPVTFSTSRIGYCKEIDANTLIQEEPL